MVHGPRRVQADEGEQLVGGVMQISLDTYLSCRIALAMAMLAEPGNPKHRKAYVALHAALCDDSEREHDSTRDLIAASHGPALTRKQA